MRTKSEETILPKVIKVERDTPIFKSPSAKAKILADVDAGTVLIARTVSPKGSWLLVEDEDGNKGWMPVSRSNFRSLSPPSEVVSDEEIKSAQEENQKEEEEGEQEQKIPSALVFQAEAVASNYTWGAALSFLLLQKMESQYSRERRIGIEFGAQREWKVTDESVRDYSFPLAIRMLARDPGSHFFSGPDFGTSYRLRSESWGMGAGYSVGYLANIPEGLSTRLRFGIEWGGKTRHQFQWSMGYIF